MPPFSDMELLILLMLAAAALLIPDIAIGLSAKKGLDAGNSGLDRSIERKRLES